MAMRVLQELSLPHLRAVLEDWRQGGEAFHVLAVLPEGEKERVGELQALFREAGIPLAGGIFPQLLFAGGLQDHGALLLKVRAAPPPLLLEDVSVPEAVDRTCEELAAYVEQHLADSQEASLFCLFDALVPNIATHLDAWYLRLADRVRYFGVNAGNERFAPDPCLFDHERFVANGLLVQLLPDHPGACLEHGYGVPPHAITATSARGNCIVQIDWRPALDIYRELILESYGVVLDRSNFYTQAVHFPFGILRADGEVLVRIPVALGDHDEIICIGEIPPNSVLTLLDARHCTTEAPLALARDLAAQETHSAQDDLMLFYCAGRRLHVGEGLGAELSDVQQETGAPMVAGALSLGEIGAARAGGYPLFHNATLVGIPWAQT